MSPSTASVNSSSTVMPLIRTLSNTSASSSSSSCSCCSNVSSNSSSSFSQPSPYVCNSCSTQQFVNAVGFRQQQSQQPSLLDQSYHHQKKMKLSPIQDKFNFLNGFKLMVIKLIIKNSQHIYILLKPFLFIPGIQ